MAGVKTTQKDLIFSAERGTAWGTAVHSSPVGLPAKEMAITLEPSVHNFERCQGIRGDHENDFFIDTNGAIPTASVAIPMTPQLMELLLPGVLQTNSDYTKTVSNYTMQTHNYAELPTPKNDNDGYFYTLERNRPGGDGAEDVILSSAIPTSLKLSVAPLDNEGVLWGEFEFTGKGYNNDATASGEDATEASVAALYNFNAITAFSFGAYDLTDDLVNFEVNITSGAKLVNDIPNGEVTFPKWEVTGTFNVLGGTNTNTMKDLVYSSLINTGQTLTLSFGTNAPVADGDLTLTMFCYLTSEASNFEEAESIEFGFRGVFGSTAANEYPLQAVFTVQ